MAVGLHAELREGDVKSGAAGVTSAADTSVRAVLFLTETLNARDLQEWWPGSQPEQMQKPKFQLLFHSGSRRIPGGYDNWPT